ncbi:MAG: response regulator [Chloroflexi bacterium]|nr:response regulator [Chloroflexota bacterium]
MPDDTIQQIGAASLLRTLDAVTEPIVVLFENDRILYLNSCAAELTGYTSHEVAGDHIDRYLEPAPAPDAGFRSALAASPSGTTRAWQKKDGGRAIIRWRGRQAAIAEGGRPLFICTGSDISERYAAEQSLLQAQKMESLGTLAGGVAHDFNNLLTAVLGFAGLLKFAPGIDEEARDQIYNIEQAARRGADIAGRLLAFSRGGLARFVRLDLREVLAETVRLAAPTLHDRIEVRLAMPSSPVYIEGDFGQVQQALLNVILNARDAMAEGGAVSLALETSDTHATLTISDTGDGIDEAHQGRIFEPFFTTKDPGSGTGLGLAITYGIVRGHGGEITLTSAPGEGATFRITLPLLAVQHEAAAAEAGDGNLVLVVDDDDLTRRSVSATLAALGYNVVEVGSGALAIDLVRARPARFAAVLLDLVMPGMNGREVFHELTQLRADLPVVVCTGYAADAHIDDVMKRSIAGLLQKPFTRENLSGVLLKVGAEPARRAR